MSALGNTQIFPWPDFQASDCGARGRPSKADLFVFCFVLDLGAESKSLATCFSAHLRMIVVCFILDLGTDNKILATSLSTHLWVIWFRPHLARF